MSENMYVRAAVQLINAGLAIIPLEPGKKTPATKNGVKDWTDNPADPAKIWAVNPDFNLGATMGQVSHGTICLDVDVHHKDHDGLEFLERWQNEHGELPETWTQITGSGGKQMFYRVNREIKNAACAEIGIDVRGENGYAVMPPSLHPCGERYEWSISPEDCDIADANASVYELIDYVREHAKSKLHPGGSKHVKLEDEITKDRNNSLFAYGRSLLSRGISHEDVASLVRIANKKRCKPPLDDGEVERCIGSINSKEPGNKEAEEKREQRKQEKKQDDAEVSKATGQQIERADKRKDVTSYDVLKCLVADDNLQPVRFDVFERRPWKMGAIPGDGSTMQRPLDDSDLANIWGYVDYKYGVRNKQAFLDAFSQFCTLPAQKMNRLMDAMAKCPTVERAPDGWSYTVEGENKPPRAGSLLIDYLGCEMSEYVYEAERLLLRQIVARAMFPGCKADVMPILVGAQGIGKSTFVEKLALDPMLYLSSFSKFDEEHKRRLAGKMIVEVGELDAFGRSDMSAIKETLTDKYDETRAPYARFSDKVPRTCVFIGTTNEGRFLTDTTGNRRFLPIQCGRGNCDPHPGIFNGQLDADIRQAYGEIVAELKEVGESAFKASLKLPAQVQAQAQEAQEDFEQEDSTLVDVQNYLDGLNGLSKRVNVKMVMIEGMGYTESEYSRSPRYFRNDIARALDRATGWAKVKGKQLIRGFGTAQTWERQ